MRALILTSILTLTLTAAGCSSTVLETPDHFVRLNEGEYSSYKMRATNADGVVLGVRTIANDPEGDLGFWTKAVRDRLQTVSGYALLDEQEVTSANGRAGRRLAFGRDQGSQSYLYWVTLYVSARNLFWPGTITLIEAGGEKEKFQAAESAVEGALKGAVVD